jgi:small subunit ribosomal protein S16
MLKIRLQRVGKKNDPSFRVVLVEHTMRPRGEFIELLGSYNKVQKQKSFNSERILYWISKGAQLSATMNNLLVDEKIIDKEKVKAWRPKKKPVSAETTASKPVAKPLEVPSTPAEAPVDTAPKTAASSNEN